MRVLDLLQSDHEADRHKADRKAEESTMDGTVPDLWNEASSKGAVQGQEESPNLWKESEKEADNAAPPPPPPRRIEDLHKLYEQLADSFKDLTFKDMVSDVNSVKSRSGESAPNSPSTFAFHRPPARGSVSVPQTPQSLLRGRNPLRGEVPTVEHGRSCHMCHTKLLIFKTRCLVCGKLYCRSCVKTAMGKMTEGRKCQSCHGFRYSQRYISKAGKCWWLPSKTKRIERRWARKKPAGSSQFQIHYQSRSKV